MVEFIRILNTATFHTIPGVLNELSQFNYIYGANGSGKTTISRVISNASNYPSCQVRWKAGNSLQTMVYNHDFIERNFTQTRELKGVFTLGESLAETLEQIAAFKNEIDALAQKNSGLLETLQGTDGFGGKKAELVLHETQFKDQIWTLKQKYDSDFTPAFVGLRNNAEKFRDRFIQESISNKIDFIPLDDLKKKSQTIFGNNPTTESLVLSIDGSSLINYESAKILETPIIGNKDVDIAAFIHKLGNSDWVKSGKVYFDVNDNICPFCQQITPATFAKSLAEYFNETFLRDIEELNTICQNYELEYVRISKNIQSILENPSIFLDIDVFKSASDIILAKLTINIQKLNEKKNEPSRKIQLESLKGFLDSLNYLIDEVNQKIHEHNAMVINLGFEKDKLINQVWRFLLEESKNELSSYLIKKDALSKAISGIEAQLEKNNSEKFAKEQSVRSLEKQTTTIQPTIDGINALLRQFGFTSFSLGKSAAGNTYQLIRSDGSEAKNTLSEGEKTFVCFLYFYHLLNGSDTESGITTNRIVVFDDPVSSLDSDILFIVSSLIKKIFEEVRTGVGNIKQVFVLTHNVYFHKEITFNKKRGNNQAMSEETFWMVHKTDQGSKIVKWSENPVKTSYELLWEEVRNPVKSHSTIQNTLRRILENYFKILGGIDPDTICEMFSGREKMICKSLFSWVNDGSHFAQDDLYIAVDDSQIDIYLTVFRQIFKKTDHFAHYRMMMGDTYKDQSARS